MSQSSAVRLLSFLVVSCLVAPASVLFAQQDASAHKKRDQVQVFGNQKIAASLDVQDQHLTLSSIEDLTTHANLHPHELFLLGLKDGRQIASSLMKLSGRLTTSVLPQEMQASRLAGHEPGRQICADLLDEPSSIKVHWCVLSRMCSSFTFTTPKLTS
jgi:hypothetical protein